MAVTRFQFPSNGKAYTKPQQAAPSSVETEFQFPSNGKAYTKFNQNDLKKKTKEFQFPSNGKAYPKTLLIFKSDPLRNLSFNSLQTGKHIQRIGTMLHAARKQLVSIPFKRESISKVH